MSATKGTYYKALILLIAFSLGTVVSFACSVSSFFHGMHHHGNAATSHHEHSGGIKHKHPHSGHHHEPEKPLKEKNDCCSDNVLQLQKIEKEVSRPIAVPHPGFLNSFIASFSLAVNEQTEENSFFPDFVRWRLPATIQDLRIVIQSFQI